MKVWCAILLLAYPCLASAQSSLSGKVIDAATHSPIRRVAIKIFSKTGQWNAITDGEGRFQFTGIEPGNYNLITHRDGYIDRSYKADNTDFDNNNEPPIELHRQSVITGHIMNSLGQPLQAAEVQALLPVKGAAAAVVATTSTNDLGDYRLFNLNPGEYQIRATYKEGGHSEFDAMPVELATATYGGPSAPSTISVGFSAIIKGINFTLDLKRPLIIRGALRSDAGVITERATLWIAGQAGEGGHNATAENGSFTIADTAPGTYTLTAETLDKSAPKFGSVTLEVRDHDVDNVELNLRPEPRIDAEIDVEGVSGSRKFGPVLFLPAAPAITASSMHSAQPSSNGNFSVFLPAGGYVLQFSTGAPDLQVRQITYNNEAVANGKIQVRDSSEPARLVITLGPATKP